MATRPSLARCDPGLTHLYLGDPEALAEHGYDSAGCPPACPRRRSSEAGWKLLGAREVAIAHGEAVEPWDD